MKTLVDTSGFKSSLAEKKAKIHGATRAMAQAGAQVIYDGARRNAPVSDAPHMFHGTHAIYGPYSPGTLRDAFYQAYSKDHSNSTRATYHVAWNHAKAPYGFMVEFGTSHSAPIAPLGRARVELSAAASDAMEMEFERRMKE